MDPAKKVLKTNGFPKFNEMQEQCLDKLEKNLVVSAPTASGKTIIAELFILEQVMNKRKKVIYTCPLRALASEHYKDFKNKYPDIAFSLSTGDLDSSSSYLKKFDVIFCTYEKLASLLRHKTEWLNNVGCLIVDEIHELDSDRGPVLEIAITQLRNQNKDLNLLGLSATIPNALELAEWLDAKLIASDYRPVKLTEGVAFDNEIEFNNGLTETKDIEKEIDEQLVKEKQVLVFLNSRKRAEGQAKKSSEKTMHHINETNKTKLEKIANSILSVLEQPTSQCHSLADTIKLGSAFHHAGLLPKQRELVEENFRKGVIKIICATPTLAAGVNTPADLVVIPSLYRYGQYGMDLIPVREYKQMCFTKDTLISIDEGLIDIKKIVENKINVSVKSFNTKTRKIELQPITKYYTSKSDKLVNLQFSDFTKLTCTPEHPFAVIKNNSFFWKDAKDLTNDDKIVIAKNCLKSKNTVFFHELFPNNCFVLNQGNLITKYCKKFHCTEKELSKKVKLHYKRMYHIKNNIKAMPIQMFNYIAENLELTNTKKAKLLTHIKSKGGKTNIFPESITKDFLWLVGLIATDGNVNESTKDGSKYTNIRIFNLNKKIITKAKLILTQFNLIPYESIREDGLVGLEVGGTLLADILSKYFGIPKGNKTTSVTTPQLLENLDPYLIGAYLSGVFDGDGNYSKHKQKRGQESFTYRILIVTTSQSFAKGLVILFNKLSIIPSITRYQPIDCKIHGNLVKFTKPLYNIIFRKIEYIQKFNKFSNTIKTNFDINYSKYNNVNTRDCSSNNFDIIRLRHKHVYKKSQTVYNLEIKKNNNYFANGVLAHNCGRSGRPKFSTEGKSIVQANTESQKKLYLEKYVNGELEPILSKLSIVPILRTHVLGLISVNELYDDKSIWKFFEKTLYAKQLNETSEIFDKVVDIVDDLEEMGFVEKKGDYFVATPLGKRVSDLFLDPQSAHNLIQALKNEKDFDEITYLFAWANTSEFSPRMRLPKKLSTIINTEFNSHINKLPFSKEKLFFEMDSIEVYFSALILQEWISEVREQELFEKFGLSPGILFGKARILEWLAYSTIELSKVLGETRHLLPAKKLSLRLKYGVREELLSLVELKGVGRVRARKLFSAGITTPTKVKKSFLKVESLLGKKVCEQLQKQLGLLD